MINPSISSFALIEALDESEQFNVGDFITQAFLTAEHTDGTEAALVDALLHSERHIPGLAFVAVSPDDVKVPIGYVLLSRTWLYRECTEPVPVLLLAPLAVRLDYRRRGLGLALIERALNEAKGMGEDIVVVLGDPAYYSKAGFGMADAYRMSVRGDEKNECLAYTQILSLSGRDLSLYEGASIDLLMQGV